MYVLYFWQWVLPRDHRSPFPRVLLRISSRSDVDLTLLSKGWWQKGKEKFLPLFFYHLVLSTQSSSLFFYTKAGTGKREDSLAAPLNSCKPPLLLSTLHVPNLAWHLSGLNQPHALYLLKFLHRFHGNECFTFNNYFTQWSFIGWGQWLFLTIIPPGALWEQRLEFSNPNLKRSCRAVFFNRWSTWLIFIQHQGEQLFHGQAQNFWWTGTGGWKPLL